MFDGMSGGRKFPGGRGNERQASATDESVDSGESVWERTMAKKHTSRR